MRSAEQAGPDDLVVEQVRGVPVRCYAQRPHSIVALLQDALDLHAEKLLLVDPALGTSTTYAEFAELVEGAAAALSSRCAPGERVAVLTRNGLEAALAIWACARAGLIHVGLPVDVPPARWRELLALVTPSLVLVQDGFDLPGDPVSVLREVRLPWRDATPLPDQDTTYSLIATSGTTGRPKAVRITGRMTGHAAAFYTRTFGLHPGDRTAIHLPFAWVSGHITQLAPAMLSGGSAVTMAHFSAPALVQVAAEHSVTWLDVVPSIWEQLLRTDGFGQQALPQVRLAVFGGAPAPPGTLERVRERMPQLRLYDVYALSETCAPVTCLSDAEALRRPGTVGSPVPYAEVRLVDEAGEPVARGQAGQVLVRSPAITPGYWGDEAPPFTDDGWLRTGDVARMDHEGYLTVGGRAVDLIIRGGVNIYPGEVERALLATGLLADAAVFGIPSAVAGQNVAAAVVALPGVEVDRSALQHAVRDRLGAHAVPRPLRVVAELPRNRNGKVDRAVLRAQLSGATPADVTDSPGVQ